MRKFTDRLSCSHFMNELLIGWLFSQQTGENWLVIQSHGRDIIIIKFISTQLTYYNRAFRQKKTYEDRTASR